MNMTSTETKIGLTSSTRPSSRVLKPPGGGHTNIFGEPEVAVNAPRPKYNQQNSSNLNACMNSIDPNHVVEKLREEISQTKQPQVQQEPASAGKSDKSNTNGNINGQAADTSAIPAPRGRVPPGGFSSGGFW